MPRLASVLVAALTLACGPKQPDDATTGTTSETTTTATTTTIATTTSTGAPTTTGDDPITSTAAVTSTTTSTSTDVTATTELGPCEVDPASDICSAACDERTECCKCDGQTFLWDPLASTCTLAMGIVTARCPWSVNGLSLDGESVTFQGFGLCDAAPLGWGQSGQNGDIIVELCGQTCADYLAGKFQVLEVEMFCESP